MRLGVVVPGPPLLPRRCGEDSAAGSEFTAETGEFDLV